MAERERKTADLPGRVQVGGKLLQSPAADLCRRLPVSEPDASGAPRWRLPGSEGRAVPLLAYSGPSGLGRIIEANRRSAFKALELETVFTSPLSAALHTMVRQGEGIVWLPLILAGDDLAAGRLVDAGGGEYSLSVEIRLFRSVHRQSVTAEVFWRSVTAQVAGGLSPQIAAPGVP
jgi:LysR family transcriptional regulator, hypochlorite-specific transcription factor HypT